MGHSQLRYQTFLGSRVHLGLVLAARVTPVLFAAPICYVCKSWVPSNLLMMTSASCSQGTFGQRHQHNAAFYSCSIGSDDAFCCKDRQVRHVRGQNRLHFVVLMSFMH